MNFHIFSLTACVLINKSRLCKLSANAMPSDYKIIDMPNKLQKLIKTLRHKYQEANAVTYLTIKFSKIIKP